MKDEEKKVCNCAEDDCDCGCGCDCDCEDEIVELTDESGKKMKFYHVGTIEFKNAYYAAFQPAEEIEGVDDDELIIFTGPMHVGHGRWAALGDATARVMRHAGYDVYEEFCRVLDEEEECGCDDDCDCDCCKGE